MFVHKHVLESYGAGHLTGKQGVYFCRYCESPQEFIAMEDNRGEWFIGCNVCGAEPVMCCTSKAVWRTSDGEYYCDRHLPDDLRDDEIEFLEAE